MFVSTLKRLGFKIILFVLVLFLENSVYASGDANIDINFSTTANGSWAFSGSGATALYTFTPSANTANILYTDISRLLMGTNAAVGDGVTGITNASTNGAGSVKILSACSGGGTQSGNITTSAIGVTAATASSSQYTFTIIAAGSITINNPYDFTPASNASTGYPGTKLVWTAGTTIDINQAITTTGGASSGSATGGLGGDITLAAGTVATIANLLTSKGTTGGSGAGAGLCIGGAGGTITISGTSVAVNNAIDVSGGNGRAASGSNGGAGGTVSITATAGTAVTAQAITTSGGNSGTASGGTNGNGGNGGAFTINATGNITIGGSTHDLTGGTGSTGTGNGGNGGAFTAISSGGSVTVNQIITTKGGNAGSAGTGNENGGTGGAIILTAATTYYTAQNIVSSSGTSYGTGTANGGNITITGPTGVTIANGVSSTATTTGGTLTINDGNSTVTTGGGANDGNTSAAMSVGAFTKTGSGSFSLAFPGNVWTGNTTITAGTLYLGSTTTIPNSSNVNFNGGTLEMGTGLSETVGTITVAANSVLKLGTGGKTLTYSPSNGIAWAGQLTVKDWLGSTGGVSGYDGTGTTAASYPMIKSSGAAVELDATHLGKISFYRASNGLSYTATQLAASTAGEVVPTATLPVELIYFNAEKNNDEVNVVWTTASEINSSYYNILRSTDGVFFEIINKTNAAGNSNSILNYSVIDTEPKNGTNYYKLIEYDFDGAHQESQVVAVEFSSENIELSAYPNPTNNSCTFDFESENGGIYYLRAYNSAGQEVYAGMVAGIPGTNKFTLSLSDFAVGIYYFQLFDYSKKIAAVSVVKE